MAIVKCTIPPFQFNANLPGCIGLVGRREIPVRLFIIGHLEIRGWSELDERLWKWTAGILGVLFVAAFAMLSYVAGSPKDAYGMVRYALPHMHRGTLKVAAMRRRAHCRAGRRQPISYPRTNG